MSRFYNCAWDARITVDPLTSRVAPVRDSVELSSDGVSQVSEPVHGGRGMVRCIQHNCGAPRRPPERVSSADFGLIGNSRFGDT
ncbi:hypothetical protein GOP47_0029161 [Adiantum capillus-veneris]|nr:hypothetical protein GOP47_0029161 [Adiantum capillus-veneris]